MRLKVELTPRAGERDVVVLVDVLRATTATPVLLARRARVWLTPSLRAARAFAAGRDLILAGERDGLPPEGFHLSASPADLLKARPDRDVVLTTENGPRALATLLEGERPRQVLLGSFYNARAVAGAAVRLATESVSLVCAGFGGAEAIEDIVCAGFLARRIEKLTEVQPGEALRLAQALQRAYADPQEALAQSETGAMLMRLGLHEDLAVASLISQTDVVPQLVEVCWEEGQPLFAFADVGEAASA